MLTMRNYSSLIILLVSVGCVLAQQTDTADDTDCICVPYYLCNMPNRTIITDGRGIIDERASFRRCDRADQICCTLEDQITKPDPAPLSTSCGMRNKDGVQGKIINDENVFNLAEFGEFPWMVGILKSSGTYRCGGSLIHPSVVLTAAHCVIKRDTVYTVRAGEWDSSTTNELLERQDVKVSSIKLHENYTPGIYYNDVALLFLESPVTIQAHVNIVCLPSASTIVSGNCYTHGWGRERFENGTFPTILKKVEVPVVPNDRCQTQLRKTRLGPFFNLHRSFVCAGGEEGKDVCIGDGGGPLVCKVDEDREQYQQIGIVSWGIGCGDKDVPGVYSNVAFLRGWIEKQMAEKNFELKNI